MRITRKIFSTSHFPPNPPPPLTSSVSLSFPLLTRLNMNLKVASHFLKQCVRLELSSSISSILASAPLTARPSHATLTLCIIQPLTKPPLHSLMYPLTFCFWTIFLRFTLCNSKSPPPHPRLSAPPSPVFLCFA